jgi:hypothetical protein
VPTLTSTPSTAAVHDPITYRSAKAAAAMMGAIVLGGLAVTLGVMSLLYRRNRIARRRYVFVDPAPHASGTASHRTGS